MWWLRRETEKVKKTSTPAWPAILKYIGTGWRALKAWSLWRCLAGRQPTEGHRERAWILPLGFAHSPLGPQDSNYFLFSLSNVGLLTRIMMKQTHRNITRHKKRQKCTLWTFWAHKYFANTLNLHSHIRRTRFWIFVLLYMIECSVSDKIQCCAKIL